MFSTSPRTADTPKTFSKQSSLPRLPVPDLEQSLAGYVKSLHPLLEQAYGPSQLNKEIEKRQLFAKDFAAKDGLGRALQERLKDLDHVSPNNWLNDTLWLSLAYHTWRAPLLINSNYWLLFACDPSNPDPPTYHASGSASPSASVTVPDAAPSAEVPEGSQGGGSEWLQSFDPAKEAVVDWETVTCREEVTEQQIMRASWLVRRYAEFRVKVQKEEMPPDSSRAGPFCMEQYRHLFNFSRIPLSGCDAFSRPDPRATHITLLIDDMVYAVDVFVPATSPEEFPEPLPISDIVKRIQAAAVDARAQRQSGKKAPMLGLLTADERDTWVKNREHLLLLSPSNRQNLESISTSLLALCLDTYSLPSVPSSDPLRLPSIDAQVRNGSSGLGGGRNRWFDKSISLIVETNGRASFMGEHSPVDALIPSYVMDYAMAEPLDTTQFGGVFVRKKQIGGQESSGRGDGWQKLDWTVDEDLEKEIGECQERNRKLAEDSDASQLWWGEFGVEWIKKNGKVSPDAFIQQALQLAWYRDQGYATATYETASTRSMLHGRTEVIRTLSKDSRAFVKAMVDDKLDDAKRYALLQTACSTHLALTRDSSAGKGYDRHLMGLKVQLRPGETHPLFDDEMYAKSQEWKLSTSGLSAGGNFSGSGFGAAWVDGYGINYLAGPYLLKFGIESKRSCPSTSTTKFKHLLVQALRDMRRVCSTQQDGGEQAAEKPKARM